MMTGDGIPVNAVFASEIDCAVLHYSNTRIDSDSTEFSLNPKQDTFDAKILKPQALRTKKSPREKLRMWAVQLPLLINNATTGHKLQGSGVDNLFVHGWTYKTNWPYVMLACVTTKDRLFLRRLLDRNLSRYEIPPSLTRMLDQFCSRSAPSYWTSEQYENLFGEPFN